MSKPRVEIAGYRDPDGEVHLSVVIDGQLVTPDLNVIVDPGSGGLVSPQDWAGFERDVLASPDASPVWLAEVGNYLDGVENAGYIDGDRYTAIDAQPGVPDDELDPRVWIGEGVIGHVASGQGLVWDNTARAGMALRAIQASDGVPEDTPAATPTQAALCGHLAIDPALWAGVDADTSVHAAQLLADLMHLADARNVDIGGPPPNGPGATLHPRITRLIGTVRTACTQDWVDTLTQPWDHITRQAARRHQAQTRGTPMEDNPA